MTEKSFSPIDHSKICKIKKKYCLQTILNIAKKSKTEKNCLQTKIYFQTTKKNCFQSTKVNVAIKTKKKIVSEQKLISKRPKKTYFQSIIVNIANKSRKKNYIQK